MEKMMMRPPLNGAHTECTHRDQLSEYRAESCAEWRTAAQETRAAQETTYLGEMRELRLRLRTVENSRNLRTRGLEVCCDSDRDDNVL